MQLLNPAVVLHRLSIGATLPSLTPSHRMLSSMVTQVDVCAQALAPAHESSIFEHPAVSQEPRDQENQGRIIDGHEATVSTSVPDLPSSPLPRQEPNLPPNQPPDATEPDVSQRPGNDGTSNTETRPSQETPSAVGIHSVPDPIENVWDYSVPIPGSRQKKRIYPKAPVEFGPWSQEQCHARFFFVKNELEALVNKHLDLHGLERRPVYTPRMVGTTPSTTFPSIVITCRKDDAKALQDLFRSRAEDRLYVGKGSTLSQLRSSLGKQREKDESIPRLRLVYYRTPTSTVTRRASEEPLTAYIGSSGAYCGGLIQYQDASATLGPSIDIDGMNAVLTVGHLFPSKGSADSSLVNDDEGPPSDGSDTSTLNDDDIESMDGLWEDDDEYDDFEEDDSPHPGRAEDNLPHERKLPGLPGPGKEKLAGRGPELWERVVPPADLSPSSPYLDWALARPILRRSLFSSRTNAVFPDGPDGRHVFLDQIRHQPPSHLASVYMVSGVRRIAHGQILFGSSFLPSFPGQDYCEAWTIILDNSDGLINGECGSIVIDRATNEVYGHVVGSDPLGHAYVVPLAYVLEQVKACFEAKHVGLASPAKASGSGHPPQQGYHPQQPSYAYQQPPPQQYGYQQQPPAQQQHHAHYPPQQPQPNYQTRPNGPPAPPSTPSSSARAPLTAMPSDIRIAAAGEKLC
ncbi:hypothetical protein B0J13DRAFT_272324 [Dactylonectria estremocensis]|uniref:Uncharacterized protein n=1 Tax=Dactylonectria estremocensis TaxID=1079267 RepID=A0A9P9D2L8_9HYPO|nr:hypothetical protein B0J13DRAFT_272324 [Dactylonectria estremocensis]